MIDLVFDCMSAMVVVAFLDIMVLDRMTNINDDDNNDSSDTLEKMLKDGLSDPKLKEDETSRTLEESDEDEDEDDAEADDEDKDDEMMMMMDDTLEDSVSNSEDSDASSKRAMGGSSQGSNGEGISKSDSYPQLSPARGPEDVATLKTLQDSRNEDEPEADEDPVFATSKDDSNESSKMVVLNGSRSSEDLKIERVHHHVSPDSFKATSAVSPETAATMEVSYEEEEEEGGEEEEQEWNEGQKEERNDKLEDSPVVVEKESPAHKSCSEPIETPRKDHPDDSSARTERSIPRKILFASHCEDGADADDDDANENDELDTIDDHLDLNSTNESLQSSLSLSLRSAMRKNKAEEDSAPPSPRKISRVSFSENLESSAEQQQQQHQLPTDNNNNNNHHHHHPASAKEDDADDNNACDWSQRPVAVYRALPERVLDLLAIEHAMQSLRLEYSEMEATTKEIKRLCQEEKENAAKAIQRAVRRKQDVAKRHHRAAIKIQSRHRTRVWVSRYVELYQSCRTIQRIFRKCQQRDNVKRNLAATSLQRVCRGHLVRVEQRNQIHTAITIQSMYRRTLAVRERDRQRQKLRLCQASSISVQRIYRSHRSRQLGLRKAAAAAEAARGLAVRSSNSRRGHAATKIQALVRGTSFQASYLQIQSTAIVMQRSYRTHRNNTTTRNHAAILIQKVYRGQSERQRKEEEHCAATRIQTVYLKHAVIRRKAEYNYSVTTIQRVYRGHVAKAYQERQHTAATKIQGQYRKHSNVTGYRQKIQDRNDVATKTIQRTFRLHRAGILRNAAATMIQKLHRSRDIRTYKQRQEAAAARIQCRFRMCPARSNFLATYAAIVFIQNCFRKLAEKKIAANKAREEERRKKAARDIQNRYRRYSLRRDLAATKIQSNLRMKCALHDFLGIQCAVLVIQNAYRGSKRKVTESAAAETIQTGYRGRAARLRRSKAARDIQNRYRRYSLRRDLAATKIQSNLRMKCSLYDFLGIQCAVLVIQNAYRARKRKVTESAAAETIQTVYRGRAAELRYSNAALVIQNSYRNHSLRQDFAATKIQSNLIMKSVLHDFLGIQCAVLVIQHAYRARKRKVTESAAVVTIQKVYRYHAARLRYSKAARFIQNSYRNHSLRRDLAATRIQPNLIMKSVLHDFLGIQYAVLVIQHAYRGSNRKVAESAAAETIQTVYRGNATRLLHEEERGQSLQLLRATTEPSDDTGRKAIQTVQLSKASAVPDQLDERKANLAVLKVFGNQSMSRHHAAAKIQKFYREHVKRRRMLGICSFEGYMTACLDVISCCGHS